VAVFVCCCGYGDLVVCLCGVDLIFGLKCVLEVISCSDSGVNSEST